MDALSEFCAGLTPADVERERLAPLSLARQESFGARGHQVMLATHEMRVWKFHIAMHGAREVRTPTPPKPKYRQVRKRRRPPAQQFTSAQIEAALQAMRNREAS